jgi:rare lipoprotein A
VLFALMAMCKVLLLWCVHAEAIGWDSFRGQVGWASWYGKRFHGRETASGERFSVLELTAAHRSLPLGTKVLVTNLDTDEVVEVKINDRGPLPRRRIIDLSRAAADSIGLLERGVGRVRMVVSEQAIELQDTFDYVMYEVQVGVFVEREQALGLVDQLEGRYPSAYIAARDGPLGRYYRVRVGPFDTRQDAQQTADALKRAGYYVFVDEVAGSAILAQRLRSADDEEPMDMETGNLDPGLDVAFRFREK